MRATVAILLQFLLFLITFALGSFFLHPFHVQTVLAAGPAHTRAFLWDGLLLMLLLYLLVLLLETATKRLRQTALGSTLALILAASLGLLMKFGFLTVDR